MYLSRLILDPRSRQVRSEVGRLYELHRTLMRAFPGETEGGPGRVLFRLEPPAGPEQAGLILLVQSDKAPDWTFITDLPGYLLPGPADNPACRSFEPVFTPGQLLHFRLRANPTKRLLRDDPEGGLKKGKRVGLYTEEAQLAWLGRKAESGGFAVLEARVLAEDSVGGKTRERHDLNLLAVRFDGQLRVTDPDRFLETLAGGIGSGKGLGFGLLSLARA